VSGRRCLSSPVARPSSPVTHRRPMHHEWRRQGVTGVAPLVLFIYLFSTCNLRRVLPDESPMNVSYLVRGGVAGRSPAGRWAVGLGGVAATVTNLGRGRCVLASEKNKPRYCSN
jgi:hypothetical protein